MWLIKSDMHLVYHGTDRKRKTWHDRAGTGQQHVILQQEHTSVAWCGINVLQKFSVRWKSVNACEGGNHTAFGGCKEDFSNRRFKLKKQCKCHQVFVLEALAWPEAGWRRIEKIFHHKNEISKGFWVYEWRVDKQFFMVSCDAHLLSSDMLSKLQDKFPSELHPGYDAVKPIVACVEFVFLSSGWLL